MPLLYKLMPNEIHFFLLFPYLTFSLKPSSYKDTISSV